MTKQVTVTFDEYVITEILTVNSLNRGIGPTQSFRTQNRNDKKGVRFLGTSSTVLTHEMDFTLMEGVIEKRREISRILNVSEPKKLIYSDEPDKFYWALPSGDTDFEDKRLYGDGSITWQIFDGLAYSTEEYSFTNDGADPRAITINNPGTEPMLLELEAEFTSDCGFLGLQNDDLSTSALFGTIEEVDGYHYEASETLFDDHFTVDRGWLLNQGITPGVTAERLQNGTASYQVDEWQGPPAGYPGIVDPNEGYAKVTDYGTGNSWHGVAITKIVPPDKNGAYPVNWRSSYRIDFNNDGADNKNVRVGHNSVTYSNQNDELIVAVVVEDNNSVSERSDVAIYIDGNRVWDNRETSKYYVSGRTAWVAVEKIGNEITVNVSYAGVQKSFVSKNPDAELRKITWYGAAYKEYLPIANNFFRAINVKKHNVLNWQDIPNKFGSKDILLYGKNVDNIYCTLNNNQGLQYRDPGSTLIYAPPGLSTMFLSWSDFATAPIVKLKGRAAYV